MEGRTQIVLSAKAQTGSNTTPAAGATATPPLRSDPHTARAGIERLAIAELLGKHPAGHPTEYPQPIAPSPHARPNALNRRTSAVLLLARMTFSHPRHPYNESRKFNQTGNLELYCETLPTSFPIVPPLSQLCQQQSQQI